MFVVHENNGACCYIQVAMMGSAMQGNKMHIAHILFNMNKRAEYEWT